MSLNCFLYSLFNPTLMIEYDFVITETITRRVTVNAHNAQEAQSLVESQSNSGYYDYDKFERKVQVELVSDDYFEDALDHQCQLEEDMLSAANSVDVNNLK